MNSWTNTWFQRASTQACQTIRPACFTCLEGELPCSQAELEGVSNYHWTGKLLCTLDTVLMCTSHQQMLQGFVLNICSTQYSCYFCCLTCRPSTRSATSRAVSQSAPRQRLNRSGLVMASCSEEKDTVVLDNDFAECMLMGTFAYACSLCSICS